MSEYKFERINPNLYKKIKELYKLAFSMNENDEFIANKYDTSMFGLRDIGILAEANDGSPAAYYGVFPITMTYQGQDFIGAQSGDTMTSPYHQKKGLFTQLAKQTYSLAADQNVKLVYGFPNKNSYPGFKTKLDWQFTGNLQNYSIINPTIPFCEIAAKYKSLEGLYRVCVKWCISKFAIQPSKENAAKLGSEICGVSKNKKFFEYKMKNKDVHFIDINGFIMLIKTNNHLQIGSVSKFEKNKLPDFLKTIKKLGVMLGCRRTILSMSKNHWLNEYLQPSIKCEEGMPIGFYVIDQNFNISDFTFTLADFDTF